MIKINRRFLIFLSDFCLITGAFFLANFMKRGNFVLTTEYRYLLFFFYSIWFISSILSKKYDLIRPKSFRKGLHPIFRSFLYMAALLFFIIFIFKLFYYSRFIVLVTLIIYLFIGTIFHTFFYFYSWGPNINTMNENNDYMHHTIMTMLLEKVRIDTERRQIKESLKLKLKKAYLKQYPKIYKFIDSAINLEGISASDSIMVDANIAGHVKSILNNNLEFFGNLHKINDIQRINKFLRVVNRKLIIGGYLVGVVETLEQRLKRKFSKYSKYPRRLFYLLDFIWTRAFPKLPVLKRFYFMIHGKDRRVISQCEMIGRLYFCGFCLVNEKEIDQKLYFIAKKARAPIEDKNPSYGPIFRQKRVGVNGEVIHTYKFRTMHPYSEYIHRYMMPNPGKLNHTGKVKDDIRVTHWGRIMRKYWIDELPMLINLLQGVVRLVGVRPISESYFSVYPKDLKKERIKYKPGLIPIFYADMPNSIAEIWESERKYLKEYEKHPWRTDFFYFFKIMNNILFHRARSE